MRKSRVQSRERASNGKGIMTESTNVRPITVQVLDDKGKVVQEYFFAQEKIVVGRIMSADLKIEDDSISRVHALIEILPAKITITDLASTHGTFVNGQKTLSGELKAGQELRIGKVRVMIKDGALEKVPEEFRQSYMATTATPPLGTPAPRTPTPPGVPARAAAPTVAEQPTRSTAGGHATRTTGGHAAHKKTTKGDAGTPVPTPKKPPSYKERESFTQEIVKKHAHVIGGGQCLEMTVYWHETVLDDSVYRTGTTVTIGEGGKNDFMIPMGHITPADSFDFVEVDEGGATLLLHPDMTGRLRLKDQMHDMKELHKIPGVNTRGALYSVRMGRKDFAKITVGTLTFFMIFVPEPPPIPPLPFFEPDPRFRRIAVAILLLLLFLGIIMRVFFNEYKPTLESAPENIRQAMINPNRERPQIFARKARVTQEGGNEGEGAKGEGAEGKRGEQTAKQKEGMTNIPKMPGPKKPPGGARKAAAKQKEITDKQVAKNSGILGLLGGKLGKQFGKIAGPGSGGGGNDPFGKLMLGLSGPGAGTGSGYGTGTGLKGTGSGGGGTAAGIGGLGLKGTGTGRQGYGSGSIPGKGEASIGTVAENVQVLGSLDKSVIEAVVRRHLAEIRYCYEAELQRYAGLKGKVVTGWTIGADGHVTEAHIVESSMGNQAVDNCVRTTVKRWQFPSPQGGGIVLVKSYPFIFSRR